MNKLHLQREPLQRAWGDGLSTPTDKMRHVAEGALQGIVYFYNDKPTSVGRSNIDWSGAHHHHQEWPAQLNRFYWLGPLAALYRENGDEKYAAAARDYIADWMRAHPTRPDWDKAPRDSTLNLCIRLGNSQWPGWMGCLPVFAASAAFDADFVEQVIASCQTQLNYLADNISGGSNWRIANADALVVGGVSLSFLPQAPRWRAFGVRVINDAWQRQVLPDGTHRERNPGYHRWMTRVMFAYWKLQQEIPELGLTIEAKKLARMFDYSLAVARPNGSLNAMHDCQGERSGSHQDEMRDLHAEFLHLSELPEEESPTSRFFPDAGQAFLRDSWEEDATYLTFDATQWGGSHCHLSRNAIQLHANGRSLLVDPGTFTYERSDPFCTYGNSTRAHNTLNLNGWNQDIVNPQDTRAHRAPGYDFVSSEYRGAYWSKPFGWRFDEGRGEAVYATHNRMLLWLHGRAVIVIDSFNREAKNLPEDPSDAPSLEANWQLCEGGEAVIEDESRVVARYGDAGLLMLFPLRQPDLKLSLHEGEEEPLCGWLPTSHTQFVPAPQVSLGCAKMNGLHAKIATVLLPFAGDDAPSVTATAHQFQGSEPTHLCLSWADGSTDELWWTDRLDTMLGEIEDIETDGGLLHLHKSGNGRVLSGCAIEATYLAPRVKQAAALPRIITF